MLMLPRVTTLASCLAVSLALAPAAQAATRNVSNCLDSGPGSLRAAIAGASLTGDTVVFDTGSMACSTITLTSGEIAVDAQDITIQGPGSALLTIDGNNGVSISRVFFDRADGAAGTTRKITINGLTIANGLAIGSIAYGLVRGGCIDASGDVTLSGTVVTGCLAVNTDATGQANGGAIYARSLHMSGSTIMNSTADANSALGGGAYVEGVIDIRSSSIIGNNTSTGHSNVSPGLGGGIATRAQVGGDILVLASTISGNESDWGGGMYVYLGSGAGATSITIDHSTISGNHAYISAGALRLYDAAGHMTARILDSTISSNTSSEWVGGISNNGAALTVSNSTIAFNSAQSYLGDAIASGLYSNGTTVLHSSIIAKNTDYGPSDLGGGGAVSGSGNLVIAAVGGTIAPAGTLTADPLLVALADNGGPTRTHALQPGSPALSTGNNVARLASDQRGPGFARSSAGKTDIGAFQSGDGIFYGGFD